MVIRLIKIFLIIFLMSCSSNPNLDNKETKLVNKLQFNEVTDSSFNAIINTRIREFAFQLKNGLEVKTSDWTVRGGIWDFSDINYYGQGTQTNNKAYYNKSDFSDFIFEVKMSKITEDGPCGLLFRYNEITDNGYIIEIYPHGSFIFGVYNLGVRKVLIGEPIKKFKRGLYAWNKVKIEGRRDSFKVFINDFLIDSLKDNRYAKGRVGFYIHGGPRQQAHFQVLQIKKLK